jgi:hypothetical protein
MKRLEITEKECRQHPCKMEWWEYVRKQWIDAGFDMSKSVTQVYSNATGNIVFTQED